MHCDIEEILRIYILSKYLSKKTLNTRINL